MTKITSDTPVCSVCIANYNGMGYIDACLKSVLTQDCFFPIEIIVHDDASTDGSVEFIRDNFPEVTLIASNENVGFCGSNNRMAQKANGKYLLFLNNDAVLFPDALRQLFQDAEKETAILSIPQYNAATGELIDRGEMFDLFLNPIPNPDPGKRNVGMVIGACLWLPRSLWDELGGFPEWFHYLAEDTYLCCLARLKGYPVRVLSCSGYYHWVGASLGGGKLKENRLSTTLRRRAFSERNKTFVIVLCYPAPFFQLLLPLHLFLLILEGTVLSAIKQDITILKIIYIQTISALWSNRRMLCLLRRRIQRTANITPVNFFRKFSLIPYKLKMFLKYGVPAIH